MKRRRRFSRISLLPLLLASTITVDSTIPSPRYGQSSVYASNTAYFLGGILSDTSLSTDFFSLDLSQPFNSSSPPWQNLTSLPAATANAAAAIGTDGRVYLLGGETWDCSTNFLNVYDPHTSTWGTPQFFGTAPTRRQSARTFLSNDNDIIFYFGGSSTSCSTGAATVYNTLTALSLQNSTWFTPANSNPPDAESYFALTKVETGTGSSEQVLIVGGQTATQNTFVQMSQLGLFDMTSQSWSFVNATTESGQDPPEERVGHTAVTTSDGKVIVFGGTVGPSDRAAVPQLTILDTSTSPFQWSTPNIGGNVSLGPSAGLTGHSAIITDGDMMILAFGKDTNGNYNQKTYFLDTQKMEWQEFYTPSKTSPSPSSPDSPSTTNNAIPSPHETHINGITPNSPESNSEDTSSSSNKTTIAVSTSIPLSLLALTSAAILIVFLRKRNRKHQRDRRGTSKQYLLSQQSHEMDYISPSAKYPPPQTPRPGHPSKRVFQRIFSRGKAHASPPPNPHSPQPMGVFLPAWAQQHAREGGSNKSSSACGDDDDDGVENRMVQVASMSFMAPKMQLRVVNPDQLSLDNFDDEGSFRRRISAGGQV